MPYPVKIHYRPDGIMSRWRSFEVNTLSPIENCVDTDNFIRSDRDGRTHLRLEGDALVLDWEPNSSPMFNGALPLKDLVLRELVLRSSMGMTEVGLSEQEKLGIPVIRQLGNEIFIHPLEGKGEKIFRVGNGRDEFTPFVESQLSDNGLVYQRPEIDAGNLWWVPDFVIGPEEEMDRVKMIAAALKDGLETLSKSLEQFEDIDGWPDADMETAETERTFIVGVPIPTRECLAEDARSAFPHDFRRRIDAVESTLDQQLNDRRRKAEIDYRSLLAYCPHSKEVWKGFFTHWLPRDLYYDRGEELEQQLIEDIEAVTREIDLGDEGLSM